MNEWQDISTAPKDGIAVLICTWNEDYSGIYIAWWVDGGWYNRGYFKNVTHWMPLPPPPPPKGGPT